MPADDLTDPAPANTFAHLDAFITLSRPISEKGIYPAIDPLDSTSRALQPDIVSPEHYETATRVQEVLQRYKDLQDIIAILGMDELSDEDRLIVAAGAQDRALPLAADVRRRGVHRPARQVRAARGHDQRLHRRSSTASTTSCPSRPSTWSATIEEAVDEGRGEGDEPEAEEDRRKQRRAEEAEAVPA